MDRGRLTALVALLAVAGVTVVLVIGSGSPPKAGDTSGLSGAEASTVERRNLVEADTEAGTLSYAHQQTVYDRLSGTITWLPSVGQEIKPGGTLFMVDGKPVVLMDGATPAYRELAPGVGDGRDVLQLNLNLLALGFAADAILPDDEWQPATTIGVEALQSSLGESATGRLPLGWIVFLPGDQLISTVETTLGSGGGGSGAASPSNALTGASASAGSRQYASFSSATLGSPTVPAPASTPEARRRSHHGQRRPSKLRDLERQLALLRAELAKHKAGAPGAGKPTSKGSREGSPDSSSSPGNADGTDEGAGPTPILQTTSTRLIVTVALDASKQSEARVGEHVTIQLPNGEAVGGSVTHVSPIAESSTNNTAGSDTGSSNSGGPGASSAAIPVTITIDHQSQSGLDQAAVSVEFAQAIAREVLSVPVTALLATGGANYAVQEAPAPHRLIPVSTGLFAAGYVQVSGPGLHAGMRVSDPQG